MGKVINSMEEIQEHFREGILFPTYQAMRNLEIWKRIADEVPFLEKQSREVQKLYSFMQESASTNFALSTAKLFDNSRGSYPTRSLPKFFKLIEQNVHVFPLVENTDGCAKLLKEQCAPISIIEAIWSDNSGNFPKEFAKHFSSKLDSVNLKNNINALKEIRDKTIAHNEAKVTRDSVEIEVIENLLQFAKDVISIFKSAYNAGEYLLKQSVERDVYFITHSINAHKK